MIDAKKNIFNIKFLHFLKLRVLLTKCATTKNKLIKIPILVLSQLSMEIYQSTLATQKLATFLHIIQVLHRKLAD